MKQSSMLHLSTVFLIPTISIWVIGFLAKGANIPLFLSILDMFHAYPKPLQLVFELVFPILAGIFARQGTPGKKRTTLLFLSMIFSAFAILGLLFAPKT